MREKAKKSLAVLMMMVLLCGLTACGNQGTDTMTEEGKVKIRAYLGGGDLSEKIDAMVEDFNAQSKTTEVEVVPMPADTASMITVMFNSGNTGCRNCTYCTGNAGLVVIDALNDRYLYRAVGESPGSGGIYRYFKNGKGTFSG